MCVFSAEKIILSLEKKQKQKQKKTKQKKLGLNRVSNHLS